MTHGSTIADPAVLQRNIAALARVNPRVAELVLRAAPRADVTFAQTDDGVPAASIGSGPDARQLCSRRRPLDEACKVAQEIDTAATGVAVVLGFALGYHVATVAERLRGNGLVIVFEPDIALLRAVMERVDCSWLAHGHIAIITDPEDRAALATLASGFENVFAVGTRIVTHAPSKARLGEGAQTFADHFTSVLKAVRTTLVTTLVQADVTLGNALGNVGPYAMAPGIEDLRDAARGRPAIVVSGGPSLRRNMHLLARPGVRDRFVIVAVQTVLKPLLAMGVKPHFVTALDHARISKRFYEGLTARDVEGVTLVCEAKGNPSIVRAFPGVVRFPADEWLDNLLGEHLARPMGAIKSGATVAHLAYYLARHLGCDPVVLIGQDLGFTDGQYYSSGAVIHDTWGPELNEFRTLEMFEWERIVRMRRMLRKTVDHLGRPVYTDEQLATYLVQFERDFLEDANRNLRVIDASEGGVAKKQTEVMKLAEVISQFEHGPPIALPQARAYELETAERRQRVLQRMRGVRRDVWQISENARAAAPLLEEMLRVQSDTSRLNALIDKAQDLATKSHAMKTAYHLVHYLNQTGSFNRYKADRAIGSDPNLSESERQRKSIERDLVNVRWLADSADEVGRMLQLAIERIEAEAGMRFVERDEIRMERHEEASPDTNAQPVAAVVSRSRVEAIIPVDTRIGAMGVARDLARDLIRDASRLPASAVGKGNALALTVTRLLQSRELDGITLVTHEPGRVRDLLGPHAASQRVRVVSVAAPPLKARAHALRARVFSRASWRGGVANLSVFDECFEPVLFSRVMNEHAIDAAVLVGPDWPLVDPVLTDRVIARHREDGSNYRFVFTQAAPGLCPGLVSRSLADEIAKNARGLGPLASLGAILGYLPVFPQVDPIAKPSCVLVPPAVRDAYRRFIADDPGGIHTCTAVLSQLGVELGAELATRGLEVDAEAIVRAAPPAVATPRELLIEATTRRLGVGQGLRGRWMNISGDAAASIVDLSQTHLQRVLEALGPERSSVAVSFSGRGDALLAPEFIALVRHCAASGVGAIHVRTDLNCDASRVDALLDECRDVPIDVLSVDVLAEKAETYSAITGLDAMGRVKTNVARLLALRGLSDGGLPQPWIVPRITRCDAVYEEIESFYDRWTHEAGCAIIDPMPTAITGERIEPIDVPRAPRAWRESGVLRLRADGMLCDARGTPLGHAEHAEQALRAWCDAGRAFGSAIEPKPAAPMGASA